MLPTGDVSDD